MYYVGKNEYLQSKWFDEKAIKEFLKKELLFQRFHPMTQQFPCEHEQIVSAACGVRRRIIAVAFMESILPVETPSIQKWSPGVPKTYSSNSAFEI